MPLFTVPRVAKVKPRAKKPNAPPAAATGGPDLDGSRVAQAAGGAPSGLRRGAVVSLYPGGALRGLVLAVRGRHVCVHWSPFAGTPGHRAFYDIDALTVVPRRKA